MFNFFKKPKLDYLHTYNGPLVPPQLGNSWYLDTVKDDTPETSESDYNSSYRSSSNLSTWMSIYASIQAIQQ